MCIMFVYINNDPTSEDYQLVLVNNRDEFYKRPTKPAAFWDHCQHCIGGLDEEPGRENGTWLGVSKHGKAGSLLNILTPYDSLPHKKGRGHLVCDYLQGSECAKDYLDRIMEMGVLFNAFSLVLLEKQMKMCCREPGDWNMYYYSNSELGDNAVKTLSDGLYGFSNSVYDKPLQKVVFGKDMFADVIQRCGRPAHREQLLQELTNLMNNKTKCLPDGQLSAQAEGYLDQDLFEQRSCIYVDSSQIAYGTRSTTILLVDRQGHCDYVERTMQDPIDPNHPNWHTTNHSFTLTNPSTAKI